MAEQQLAKATVKSVRTSPYKLNQVLQLIRGLHVSDALNQLAFSRRRISDTVYKALQSAIANAENNHGLDIDNLEVAEAYAGKGLVMKRFRARARGRGARIMKPFSNFTIVVRERAEEE